MEAELVAIAGNFRVFEEDMPADIKSKSVRIHLDKEQLIISQL
jgi:septum formation inhibitor MinC